jgi:hypothetical protein
MIKLWAKILAGVVGLLVAGGCGWTSTGGEGSASYAESAGGSVGNRPAACSLISKAEMEGILGGPLAGIDAEERGYKTTCTYLPAEGGYHYAEVTIEWEDAKSLMAGMRFGSQVMGMDAGFSVTTPVEGLGDEAFILIGGVLNVRKGDVLIMIDLRMQGDAEEKGKEIARKVLARI